MYQKRISWNKKKITLSDGLNTIRTEYKLVATTLKLCPIKLRAYFIFVEKADKSRTFKRAFYILQNVKKTVFVTSVPLAVGESWAVWCFWPSASACAGSGGWLTAGSAARDSWAVDSAGCPTVADWAASDLAAVVSRLESRFLDLPPAAAGSAAAFPSAFAAGLTDTWPNVVNDQKQQKS